MPVVPVTGPDNDYFRDLEADVDRAYAVAEEARAQGQDPRRSVEIPVAKDMADRVQNLLGIPGVAERVRELEAEMSREEAALELAADFAAGRVGDATDPGAKIEGAVRTAVALLTEGVVAAPIEGIDGVELATNDDGSEFVRIYYAGPIRSAGGTAQALSVLVADYTRALLDIGAYQPREDEIERYAEEVGLYDQDTGLQYTPSADETRFIARHCPICLDGEPTADLEVSGFRDLERVDTNRPRGGLCLVLAEGIALKAPKIKRYTSSLDEVAWPWLDELMAGDVSEEDASEAGNDPGAETADGDGEEVGGLPVPAPKAGYLDDLIAGRPVFAHPSEPGGFRLRYGRARNHGFATMGIHPATMHLLDDFLAAGTQVKTERPGKAAGVVPVDSIAGPVVRLRTGEVRRISDAETAKQLRGGVDAILDVGDALVNVGEFVENNYPLAPAGYAPEWWMQDLTAAGADGGRLADDPAIDLDRPTPDRALSWAERYDAPLHPRFTYLWHDVSAETVADLVAGVEAATRQEDGLRIAATPERRRALETLLVRHEQTDDELRLPTWRPFARSLGFDITDDGVVPPDVDPASLDAVDGLEAVNELAPFRIRAKAPTRIGLRMGRPEKSESRELSPAVHTLFPIGNAGGDQRDVSDARRHAESMSDQPGEVTIEVGQRRCPDCETMTFRYGCPDCDTPTVAHWECSECGTSVPPPDDSPPLCPRCEEPISQAARQAVDLDAVYQDALDQVGERPNAFPILKGVKSLMSRQKTPEPMAKGILRAKHGVSAFKDGTVRYDMTDLPVTAVRPEEIDVSVGQLRELGYETDLHGDPLEHADQLVPLKVQDVVLSSDAADHLMATANFVDDLLESFYDLEPFYDVSNADDLIGELVFGMAPHTSAAVVGRIVGFTDASAGYAHPYFHAAKRRNCFHPATKLWFSDADDCWRYERVDDFVEAHLDTPTVDDMGTVVDVPDGAIAVPSLNEQGELEVQPVDAVSKHPAPDHLMRIRTDSGREVTVTPDHELHHWDHQRGQLQRVSARDLTAGDAIVGVRGLGPVSQDRATEQIDLLRACLETDAVPTDRLVIDGLTPDQHAQLEHRLARISESDESEFRVDPGDRFPVSMLAACVDSQAELLGALPVDVPIAFRNDANALPRVIDLTTDLATLLGACAADGCVDCRRRAGQASELTIDAATSHLSAAFFGGLLERVFGVAPEIDDAGKVTVTGQLFAAVLSDVLGCGPNTRATHVPQSLFDAPLPIVAAYLRSYLTEQATDYSPGDPITVGTASRELKEDLLALLALFEITPSEVYRTEATSVQSTRGNGTATEQWVLQLSSNELARFDGLLRDGTDRDGPPRAERDSLTPSSIPACDGGSAVHYPDRVTSTTVVTSPVDHVYCLTVDHTHALFANQLSSAQCDGDEDCVMLLMDGLLNFSQQFLPEQRGGSMDAPLVMSTRIDPAEIDDEAHNMDIVDEYPRDFYEATLEMAAPDTVDIGLAGETVGTDSEYDPFPHTHDTTDIAGGPALSAYKTLDSMTDKMDAQLELARKLRAVREADVAERVIESHFLPDLLGNLRAFSSQETRCLDCGVKYRRPPLTGDCRSCGGNVNLTVHRGSVEKYMETALEVAEQYDCPAYTRQRLRLLDRSIESVFEDDQNKQSGIADFM